MGAQEKLVHYYVHGRGMGHATRSAAVIGALRTAGYRVVAFAGPDAFLVLSRAISCRPVESLPPRLELRTLWRLGARLLDGYLAARAERPSVVVSDSDLPGLLAARLAGLPAVVVGHGLLAGTCRRPTGISKDAWRREALKVRSSSLGAHRHVVVSFVPLSPLDPSRTIVAAPLLPPDLLANPRQPDPAAPLVAYFRDDNAQRVLDALSASGRQVALFSRHHQPSRPGVQVHPLGRGPFLEALRVAPAVVASAGSQLMSECVLGGVPLFALHDARDDEQRINVEMLRSARLGDGCSFDAFHPELLTRFLSGLSTRVELSTRRPEAPPEPGPPVTEAVLSLVRELAPLTP